MENTDIEIERAVIGEILTFEQLKSKALLLEEDDFAYEKHREIATIMRKQLKEKNCFDFITVANECGQDFRDDIENCVAMAISVGLFDEHFKLLKQMASRRRIIKRFNDLKLYGQVSVASLEELLELEKKHTNTHSLYSESERKIEDFLEGLNTQRSTVLTGIKTIDRVTGGIRRGTVFILGARPSTGKTAFALNIAANQLEKNTGKVMFFSLEMSCDMIYERLISALGGIEYEKFSQNTLSDEEVRKVRLKAEMLKRSKRLLVIDDVYCVEQICNLINEHKPILAVVDFVQIVSSGAKFDNIRNRIDYISSLFKRTAKACDSVIMVLSQLSRIGKDAPTMSDLKESGGLEQDGDYIALLHRPYVLNKADRSIKPEDTELLLDKNKFGRTGKVDLYFDLKHQKFHLADNTGE